MTGRTTKLFATLLHFIPSGMLLLATGHWPYGYYMLLRVVVLAAALLLAGLIYQRVKQFTIWLGLFLVAALVFNPFVSLHLTRGVWSILNVAAAALFVGHFIVARPQATDAAP
jgi:hypothetical protein